MEFESLIFDIDGTLWDSRALVAEGYNIQLRAEGLERLFVTAEDLLPLFGKVMTDIADVILAEVPTPERYCLMERCMATENRYLAENPCQIGYPKVKETLEQLAKRHRLFIVSNSQCGYPELCMDKLGIRELISGFLCFGDTGTEKGQTIRTLMGRYGVENAAYIGDTEGDLQAAEAAGIPFIWASYGFGAAVPCAAQIDCMEDLMRILK